MAAENKHYRGRFLDAATYDPAQKTAISVRDGVIEYAGSELGIEPSDKMFTVYRSPATISNAAMAMRGIPLTADHVPMDAPAPSSGGFVTDARMIDAKAEDTNTTIAIRNELTLSDEMLEHVGQGRREMSLGYNADLVPHDVYDFEQKDITPHHLAAVPDGRCGPMCSFLDAKPAPETEGGEISTETDDEVDDMSGTKKTALHKQFQDAEGGMNLQQVVELATALPEAIKQVPIDKLSELTEPLQNIMAAAKEQGMDAGGGDASEEEDYSDMDNEKDKSEMTDAKQKQYLDAAVKRHAAVIDKASAFLPSDYNFTDKGTEQIMRDAVATQTTDSFTDSELPIAFKTMKRPEKPAEPAQPSGSPYAEFADSGAAPDFDSIADKEIGS